MLSRFGRRNDMAALRLLPAAGVPILVDKDQAIVGREPTCDVFVNDGSVSRRHARLERRGAAWFVVDQGSANGTYLDSQRVSDALLRPGQELRFGAVGFRVEVLGDAPAGEGTLLSHGASPYGAAPAIPTAPPLPPRPGAPPPGPVPPPGAPPQWPSAPAAPRPPQQQQYTPPAPPVAAPAAAPPRAPSPGAAPPLPRPAGPPPAPAVAGGARVSPDTRPYRGGEAPRGPRPPRAVVEDAPPGKQGRGALFWGGVGCGGCLLAVLLLVAAGGSFFYFSAKGPRDAVKAQLEQIRAGQLEAAYARFAPAYRQQVSPEAFAAFVARHPALKSNADSTFMQLEVSGPSASLSGYLATASGEREVATYGLVKDGAEWRITHMEVASDRPEAHTAAAAAAATGVRMDSVEVDKRPIGTTVEVTISMNVSGFEVRQQGDQYAFDLALDVETVGPDGLLIDALTRADVQRYQRTTSMGNGAVFPLRTALTLDRTLPEGTYVVRLRVRDIFGGGQAQHEVNFTLP
jgi:hypothetical protein